MPACEFITKRPFERKGVMRIGVCRRPYLTAWRATIRRIYLPTVCGQRLLETNRDPDGYFYASGFTQQGTGTGNRGQKNAAVHQKFAKIFNEAGIALFPVPCSCSLKGTIMRSNFPLFSSLVAGCIGLLAASVSAQTVAGYANPAGYQSASLGVNGSVFAVGPDGKLAVGQDNSSGGATITVYDSTGANRHALTTFSAPIGDTFNYFGGIAWKDANTLAFSENFGTKTAFSASLTTGIVTPLAPNKSLPNVAQIAYKPGDASGTLYAALANGPDFVTGQQQNAIYTVANGAAAAFATGLGGGYLGGLAFRPTDGALFVGDTNDPTFSRTPGQVLQIGANGAVTQAFSLAGGGGGDIGGITFDAAGNLFATTNETLSELPFGASQAINFGTFAGGNNAYSGDLQFFGGDFSANGGGSGTLFVNPGYGSGVSGLFAIRPSAVPEPSGLLALSLGAGGFALLRRNRKGKRA